MPCVKSIIDMSEFLKREMNEINAAIQQIAANAESITDKNHVISDTANQIVQFDYFVISYLLGTPGSSLARIINHDNIIDGQAVAWRSHNK
jgi:hypothetical protein